MLPREVQQHMVCNLRVDLMRVGYVTERGRQALIGRSLRPEELQERIAIELCRPPVDTMDVEARIDEAVYGHVN